MQLLNKFGLRLISSFLGFLFVWLGLKINESLLIHYSTKIALINAIISFDIFQLEAQFLHLKKIVSVGYFSVFVSLLVFSIFFMVDSPQVACAFLFLMFDAYYVKMHGFTKGVEKNSLLMILVWIIRIAMLLILFNKCSLINFIFISECLVFTVVCIFEVKTNSFSGRKFFLNREIIQKDGVKSIVLRGLPDLATFLVCFSIEIFNLPSFILYVEKASKLIFSVNYLERKLPSRSFSLALISVVFFSELFLYKLPVMTFELFLLYQILYVASETKEQSQ